MNPLKSLFSLFSSSKKRTRRNVKKNTMGSLKKVVATKKNRGQKMLKQKGVLKQKGMLKQKGG
jgi:hypothetical protein